MVSALQSIYINDDNNTFTVFLPSEYYVYQCNPFKSVFHRENIDISIRFGVTCLGYRLLACTGLPADPEFDSRCVCIFDHDQKEEEQIIFKETLKQHVLALRISSDLLIVGFHQHIEIWDIGLKKQIQVVQTALNIHSPCDMSSNMKMLAFSGQEPTSINVYFLEDSQLNNIKAADDTVSMVKFSHDSKYVATTSSDGKVVRVFETDNFNCIKKFKRGNTASVIHSIAFSPDNDFIAIISQNGTLHFFDLRNKKGSSVSTDRAFHKITIGSSVLSHILWYSPSQIAVMTMRGQMVNIAIEPNTCHEVGREQKVFYETY